MDKIDDKEDKDDMEDKDDLEDKDDMEDQDGMDDCTPDDCSTCRTRKENKSRDLTVYVKNIMDNGKDLDQYFKFLKPLLCIIEFKGGISKNSSLLFIHASK